ncbi:unnamed protein product [Adineta steineri]|uniref:Uncharacterized protein n=1 Tax=Adineta steineri TaxID=433720 RepID=A0A819Q5S0_9BILA|nr:unnamed protein product [Adineta steineri]CAF4023404.1 unnamed protein product [Adineta steineri]
MKCEEFRPCAYSTLKGLVEDQATTEMTKPILAVTKHKDHNVRGCAHFLLQKLGEKGATAEAINTLLVALKCEDEDKDGNIRLSLKTLIEATSSPPIINIWLNALRDPDYRDPDYDVRCTAVLALHGLEANASTSEVINEVLQIFSDQSPHVRENAIWALGVSRDKAVPPEVISGLLEALNDKKSGEQFRAVSVIERLGVMGVMAVTPEVITGLLQAMKEQDSDLKWRAAYALEILVKKNPTPEVINILIQMPRDQDSRVRCDVIRALGEIGQKKTTPEVLHCLLLAVDDPSDDVQQKAISVLRSLQLNSAVLSKLNINILRKLTICNYVFYRTSLFELIRTYTETQNDIWPSVIFEQALGMGFGITLVEDKIFVFENGDIASQVDISTSMTRTASKALIQSFLDQAEEYRLRWE